MNSNGHGTCPDLIDGQRKRTCAAQCFVHHFQPFNVGWDVKRVPKVDHDRLDVTPVTLVVVHRGHCLPATFRLANIEKSVSIRPTSKKNYPKNGFCNCNAQSDPSLNWYNVVDAPNDITSSTNRCFPGSSFTSGLESTAGGGITLLKYSLFTHLAIVGTAVVGLNIHDHDIFLGTVTAEYFMQVGQINIPNGHVVAATLVNQRHLCTSGTKMKTKKGKEGARTKVVRRKVSGKRLSRKRCQEKDCQEKDVRKQWQRKQE